MSDPVALNGHANVPVPVGACLCPGTPHEGGDLVYLRSRLDLRGGMSVQQTVLECLQEGIKNKQQLSDIEISIRLRETYVINGVVGWTFIDKDSPVEVTPGNIRKYLLDDFARSEAVAQKADDLYSGPVVIPFVQRLSTSLPSTPTDESTSATPKPSPKRPKRSRPSSTSIIPMDDTETTTPSLAGVSKS